MKEKIYVSKYSLTPTKDAQRKPREGALLKVFQVDGSCGYCDCHPWVEFGDMSLAKELEYLAKGETTKLTKRSLDFARIDAAARASKRHLFNDLELPKNHQHISDSCLLNEPLLERYAKEGTTLIKVKVGADIYQDSDLLKRFASKLRQLNLKLRLDFNSKLDHKNFLEFLKQCDDQLDVVDFFEDPFDYDPIRWQEVRENQKIKLACDKDCLKANSYPNSCDYLVVKPAIQEVAPFLGNLSGRKLVLTSYLDHPIGQLSALHVACTLMKDHPGLISECGFLTHHAYLPTVFSQLFSQSNTLLLPPLNGFGWGYDDLLRQQEWRLLV